MEKDVKAYVDEKTGESEREEHLYASLGKYHSPAVLVPFDSHNLSRASCRRCAGRGGRRYKASGESRDERGRSKAAKGQDTRARSNADARFRARLSLRSIGRSTDIDRSAAATARLIIG